jgi:ribosome maturation factor RimP
MRQIVKDRESDLNYSFRRQLKASLEEVLDGLKFKLVEFTVSRQRVSVQIRAVIYNGTSISVDDCSRVHRAIMPRIGLALPRQNVYLEVSSPGIDRLIKDRDEFAFYIGKGVRCYRTDISDWTSGILESADEKGIVLKNEDAVVRLDFDVIAKARLAV